MHVVAETTNRHTHRTISITLPAYVHQRLLKYMQKAGEPENDAGFLGDNNCCVLHVASKTRIIHTSRSLE